MSGSGLVLLVPEARTGDPDDESEVRPVSCPSRGTIFPLIGQSGRHLSMRGNRVGRRFGTWRNLAGAAVPGPHPRPYASAAPSFFFLLFSLCPTQSPGRPTILPHNYPAARPRRLPDRPVPGLSRCRVSPGLGTKSAPINGAPSSVAHQVQLRFTCATQLTSLIRARLLDYGGEQRVFLDRLPGLTAFHLR